MKYQLKKQNRRHSTVLAILTGLVIISSIIFTIGHYTPVIGNREQTVTVPKLIHSNASATISPPSLVVQASDPFAPCSPAAANDIVCENSKTGNPSTQWDINGAGSTSIQGFATDISVNRGGTVHFKIDTPSNN